MHRLVNINVQSLLNTYNYSIEFPADWDILLIHGPNGVGKTKILKLIYYVYRADYISLATIPFDSIELTFDDGHSIAVINRLALSRDRQESLFPDYDSLDPESDNGASMMHFELRTLYEIAAQWDPKATPRHRLSVTRRLIQQETGFRQVSSNMWENPNTGVILNLREMLRMFPRLNQNILGDPDIRDTQPPEDMQNYFDGLGVHLIETQRLYSLAPAESDRRDKPNADRSIVNIFSRQIIDHMNRALRENSITSQGLDQTFPERLLDDEQSQVGSITEDIVRGRYNEQSKLRERLAEVFSIDYVRDLPLKDSRLKDWEVRVLWTYLNDTDKKLQSLSKLLDRIDLLVDIINSRFRGKELQITSADGFKISSRSGTISPVDLSSGEQHELIVLYDLLFNVTDGSLVLLDEPEISLHVSWQQRFVSDIQRISKITGSRFLIATHSPQIMHRWWGNSVALGQDEGVEDDA